MMTAADVLGSDIKSSKCSWRAARQARTAFTTMLKWALYSRLWRALAVASMGFLHAPWNITTQLCHHFIDRAETFLADTKACGYSPLAGTAVLLLEEMLVIMHEQHRLRMEDEMLRPFAEAAHD